MDIKVLRDGPTHLGDALGKSEGRPMPGDLRGLLGKGRYDGQGWGAHTKQLTASIHSPSRQPESESDPTPLRSEDLPGSPPEAVQGGHHDPK